jgi:hypothetical protein
MTLFMAQRFKEMRESQSSRSRDDRQRREQARQDKEMARFSQIAEAQRQQQEAKNAGSSTTTEIVQEQRTSLKFGFGSKPVASKVETFILTSIELVSVVAPPTILTKTKNQSSVTLFS